MNEATAGGTRVRMIPATVRRYATTRPLTERLRVAAYARVSTDDEEQLTSYEAQVDYYTKKIRENPDWTFVEVYADEGISGTNTKKRKNFNRMIDDAMAGKIDRIITKSVSRFARNTVDTLTTVRKLKEKGVGVTFEKENIDTLDSSVSPGLNKSHIARCSAGRNCAPWSASCGCNARHSFRTRSCRSEDNAPSSAFVH